MAGEKKPLQIALSSGLKCDVNLAPGVEVVDYPHTDTFGFGPHIEVRNPKTDPQLSLRIFAPDGDRAMQAQKITNAQRPIVERATEYGFTFSGARATVLTFTARDANSDGTRFDYSMLEQKGIGLTRDIIKALGVCTQGNLDGINGVPPISYQNAQAIKRHYSKE